MEHKMNFFRDDMVGIHGIDIEDYFSQENFWSLRHNDSIRVFDKEKLPKEVYFGFGNFSGFLIAPIHFQCMVLQTNGRRNGIQ